MTHSCAPDLLVLIVMRHIDTNAHVRKTALKSFMAALLEDHPFAQTLEWNLNQLAVAILIEFCEFH